MKETLFCPRALIPYLKKYIPGEPAIVIEHKQGAAGRTAVNHIYSGTKPDGLTIGAVGNVLVSGPILGLAGSNYDLDKLIYLARRRVAVPPRSSCVRLRRIDHAHSAGRDLS